jgi:hypothetical protein
MGKQVGNERNGGAQVPEVSQRDTTRHDAEQEESLLDIPALARFVESVNKEVDELLTDDAVAMRLAKVRQEAAARAATGLTRTLVEELARYGYTAVRIWLQVLVIEMQGAAAVGRLRVGLQEGDVHLLARDTAARAIVALRREWLGPPHGPGKFGVCPG